MGHDIVGPIVKLGGIAEWPMAFEKAFTTVVPDDPRNAWLMAAMVLRVRATVCEGCLKPPYRDNETLGNLKGSGVTVRI